MNNLEIILKLLYKKVPIQAVLENKIQYDDFKDKTFLKLAVSYLPYYSENEAENIFAYFVDLFREKACLKGRDIPHKLNVFDALFHYADECLTIQSNRVLCRYSRLLDWRQMILEVSEDLIVSAYLAQEEMYEEQVQQRGFFWKRVIGHNNVHLNQLLERGISENHFHLFGSAPIFHISWLSLMNNVLSSRLAENLRKYDGNRRYTNKMYSSEYTEVSFYQQYLQAALIRVLLFSKITGQRIHIGEYSVNASEAFHIMSLPEFTVKGKVKKFPTLELKQWLEEEEKQSFPVGKLFEKLCLFQNKTGRTAEDGERLRLELWENETYRQFLCGKIGAYKVRRQDVLRRLQNFGREISVKQLLETILSDVANIDLEDILLEGTDYEKYLRIWEKKTRENVLGLLQHPEYLERHITEIQATIDSFRFPPGEIEQNENMELDYALRQVDRSGASEPCFVFAGERWLLYTMLRQIYKNNPEYKDYSPLFYAYTLLKERIRSEIVQSNDNVGFRNFEKYQDRKEDLLEDAIYQNESVKLTLKETLITENIQTLELRITPCDTLDKMRERIVKLDNMIDPNSRYFHRFFYTLHFIKSADPGVKLEGEEVSCRHETKMEKLKLQTAAIVGLRERYPEVARRILGIDAASNEIGCRPQVFGRFFRYLKKHVSIYYDADGQQKLPQLRATYHVGEDFLDLADGLRAIEEAILFLNLDCGDRMGHALALGLSVEEWYQFKGYHIVLPAQDYLDNMVWVYYKLSEYGIEGFENLKDILAGEFEKYFSIIYRNNISADETDLILRNYGRGKVRLDFNMSNYYNAMKLRGDEPKYYRMGYFDKSAYFAEGEKYSINHHVDNGLRDMPDVALLYYHYHFNGKVRKEGEKTIQKRVEPDYIRAVENIQEAMQRDVASRGIAIETNPSSNYLIGTFREYARHPIIRFFNRGLTADLDAMQACPQISVSINTDDQGVFSTSLENEYSLMACALEKLVDDEGNSVYNRNMVYEWLDNVRVMGNEQSFGFRQYRDVVKGSPKHT